MTGPLGDDGAGWAAAEPAPAVLAELAAALDADPVPRLSALTAPEALPALVALLPAAQERHRRLGIPPDVTRDTLADVGRKLRVYGAAADVPWLLTLLRGDVVALGRLQFERVAEPDGHAVHVPEQGPLDPPRVDAALRRAAAELGARSFTCTSWLLDPTLQALPATSNVVRFAARFTVPPHDPPPPGGEPTHDDLEVVRFVFRRPLVEVLDPALTVGRTRLEHLVLEHLRAGRHWTEPRGTLTWADAG